MKIDRPIVYFEEFPAKHGFTIMDQDNDTFEGEENFGNMSFNWGEKEIVRKNKKVVYDKMDIAEENVVHMLPQHDDKVEFVDKNDAGKTIECDALVTDTPDLVLEMCPADCFPIIYVTEMEKPILGLVHVSRKTLVKGIIEEVYGEEIVPYEATTKGANPKSEEVKDKIKVLIGPGIRSCHYKFRLVDLLWLKFKYLLCPFLAEDKRACKYTGKRESNLVDLQNKSLDLISTIREDLRNLPLPEESIIDSELCTFHSKKRNNHLFFSHRRSVEKNEKEGRFLALASL